MKRAQQGGFSLVELMVVVAVLFVIVAVAIPSYQNYVHTARLEAMMGKIEQFRAFEENYHIDNGAYWPGSYAPGGVNDFEATLGYRLPGDHDGVSFTVAAGACGNLRNCYKVDVQSAEGDSGTYESQNGGVWTWH